MKTAKIGPDLRLEEIRLVNFLFLEWYSQRENHSIPSFFFLFYYLIRQSS